MFIGKEMKMQPVSCIKTSVLCGLLVSLFNASYAVTFTSQYNGSGSFAIYYEGRLPAAAALDIVLPNGLLTDYTRCSVNPYYNIFPDWAYDTLPGISLGAGHPVAFSNRPGRLNESVSSFCVSMAAFMPYETGVQSDVDLNKDGHVDVRDMELLIADWLYFDVIFPSMADFNKDGGVDIMDLGMMNGLHYLDASSSGVLMTLHVSGYDPDVQDYKLDVSLSSLRGGIYEVPEPATVALLTLGALVIRNKSKK
jgi:hypothetical protein